MIDYEIQGSKGGSSKPHTPVETPNNLLSVAYAKVLLAVAEGELAGQPTDRDIYLDGTPLQNEDGSYNFGGVKWEWRSGSQDQEAIEEFPEVSTEYSVGIELKDNVQWTRAVTKSQLTDLRVTFQWPALMEQASNGDTNGYKMQYAIDLSTDGGAFQEYQVYTIDGKTNTSYERTHKVKLPKQGSSWTIRARRVTPESSSSTIQDTINVKSYAEVVAVKQRYPNTALLYVEFDSRLFGTGNIPKISVKTKGRVIQVPTNYNPESRTYTGIWDGSFKWAWTNNPAWVFYDLLTQDRFGLGHKVTPAMVDKLALYEIAQYCDVMVDDGTGSGTMEPRHTCNIYIQDKAGAWKVLRDIAGIFNGMTYWDGNKFVAVADKWEPITNAPMFSRSNVVNGNFDYQAADDKSIYTSALVSYDDPDNHYNTDVEPTFETSQIVRWGGDRQTEITAIGCTSRGEAQRKGKYTLITNLYNRTVSFQTGLQGLSADVLPGKIIHVLDPLLGGRPYTGRIKASAGTVITLDRDVTAVAGDILYLTMEDGSSEGRTVVSATDNIVTVSVNYSKPIPRNSVWYLEASDLKSQLFRVTKVTNPSPNVYEIEGVEYNESKYDAIDNGARLEPRPVSVVPPGKQQAPTNLVVSSSSYIEQTMAITSLVASWDQMPNAVQYEVQWRYNDGDWISAGITGSPTITVKGIYTGNYIVRVRAINAVGVKSVWTTSVSTPLNGKTGGVPALAYLTTTPIIYGIRLNWGFPDGAGDTARTEIMYSTTTNFANAIKLGDYSYPTDMHEMHGLKAGQQFWFWGRLIDRTGNIGPWKPLESDVGVHGASSADQSEYQEYFEKQINESALYDLLNDRIDLIDGPDSLVGSVNERVKVVSDQVAQDVLTLNQTITNLDAELTNQIESVQQDLQTQIDAIDMSNTLPYDPTATYTTSQVVLGADGILYQAKQNVPLNTPPPNTTYWLDIGQAVITANGLASRVTTAEQNITNIDGRVTANSNSITGLQTQINGKADATAVSSLTTRVTEAEGDIETNAQAITGLQTSVAGKADAAALNALTTRVSAAEGTITSNSSSITTLNNQVNSIGGDNLLPNSSFEELATPTRPKYWTYTSTVAGTVGSIVDSTLPQSTKALRVEHPALPSSGYTDIVYYPTDGIARAKVQENSDYILSVWARGTSTMQFRQYIQWFNSAGTAIGTPSIIHAITGTYKRFTLQAKAPVGAVSALVWAGRIFNNGASTAAGWLEVDNVQFQEGLVATAYLPSGEQNAAAQAVATSALTTRVSAAEGTITSQGDSITILNNQIGNIGGDNLLANSSFEEIVGTTRGKYWNILASGGTTTPSMVDSPLPQSIKAQRTESSSIAANGYLDVLYINDGIARPKVTAGKQYTLSAWARGTSGQVFRQYMRFYDAAGAIIVTPTILQASLTETFQRYVFTYTAPANSATATVYAARIINGGSSAIPLWMEVDNVQFQEGAVATAYTPSVTQSVTALSDATSALTTRVTSVEGTVTSQGQSITSLTNRITDAESDIDGQATAISSLQSSVTSVDGKVTVIASSLDSLTAAYRDNDGVGDQNDAMNSWNTLANVTESRKVFADEQSATAERFSSVDAKLGENAAAVSTLEQSVATQNSANALKFESLTAGVQSNSSSITTLSNSVATQDSANASRFTQIETSVSGNTSSIQQISSSQSTTDGKLNAMWAVKAQVTAQGQYVAAGFGLGIENGPAGLQSQFLVQADKFAVVNGVNGTVTAPFVVSGGQVFMNEALITKAMITNAIIGSTISSSAQTTWGGPVMAIDFTNGLVVTRHPTMANTYTLMDRDGIKVYVSGVLRVRMGTW